MPRVKALEMGSMINGMRIEDDYYDMTNETIQKKVRGANYAPLRIKHENVHAWKT